MSNVASSQHLGWLGILRLGLVQTSIGAIVVMTTSTLNRVMVVELALPALVPGILVAIHYAAQALRPRMGHGSDVGGRRTPWIIGGMLMLASGGVCAATATALMTQSYGLGLVFAALSFLAIGVGVSAAGTNLLVLLTKRTEESRRPAAATIVWLMMIGGCAFTAIGAGKLLDPFSPARLVWVTGLVSSLAVLLTLVSVWGVEGQTAEIATNSQPDMPKPAFKQTLTEVWAEPQARLFTIFVFISMIAYSAQDLILEPFAAVLFKLTVGQTTILSGMQHQGVFLGMIVVAVCGSVIGGPRLGSLRLWTIGGCLASALALGGLVLAGFVGPSWPIRTNVFLLGVANGAYASAAIASMMSLAGQGRQSREGVRMGLWGAAQGIAFGIGGLAGTAASDFARYIIGTPTLAYAAVFATEAVLFMIAAHLAWRVGDVRDGIATARSKADISASLARARGFILTNLSGFMTTGSKGSRP